MNVTYKTEKKYASEEKNIYKTFKQIFTNVKYIVIIIMSDFYVTRLSPVPVLY